MIVYPNHLDLVIFNLNLNIFFLYYTIENGLFSLASRFIGRVTWKQLAQAGEQANSPANIGFFLGRQAYYLLTVIMF